MQTQQEKDHLQIVETENKYILCNINRNGYTSEQQCKHCTWTGESQNLPVAFSGHCVWSDS